MFHVKHEGWTVADLTPGQLRDLDSYEALLVEHAVPRGMVAASDRTFLRQRHILDSLRGVPLISPGHRSVIDLGSGAGLPGIPVAVARPELRVTLIEPRQLRVAFLELVVERLGLTNVEVFAGPADRVADRAGLCLARGFGDPAATWTVARDLLLPEGELVYWAGATFREDQLPADARIAAVGSPALESGGPIVIMTRQ